MAFKAINSPDSYTRSPNIQPLRKTYHPPTIDLLGALHRLHDHHANHLAATGNKLYQIANIYNRAAEKHRSASLKVKDRAWRLHNTDLIATTGLQNSDTSITAEEGVKNEIEHLMSVHVQTILTSKCITYELDKNLNIDRRSLRELSTVSASMAVVCQKVIEKLSDLSPNTPMQQSCRTPEVSKLLDGVHEIVAENLYRSVIWTKAQQINDADPPLEFRQSEYSMMDPGEIVSSQISEDSDEDYESYIAIKHYPNLSQPSKKRKIGNGADVQRDTHSFSGFPEFNIEKDHHHSGIKSNKVLDAAERVYKIRKDIETYQRANIVYRGEMRFTGCE